MKITKKDCKKFTKNGDIKINQINSTLEQPNFINDKKIYEKFNENQSDINNKVNLERESNEDNNIEKYFETKFDNKGITKDLKSSMDSCNSNNRSENLPLQISSINRRKNNKDIGIISENHLNTSNNNYNSENNNNFFTKNENEEEDLEKENQSQLDKYLKMENLYLQDGKCNKENDYNNEMLDDFKDYDTNQNQYGKSEENCENYFIETNINKEKNRNPKEDQAKDIEGEEEKGNNFKNKEQDIRMSNNFFLRNQQKREILIDQLGEKSNKDNLYKKPEKNLENLYIECKQKMRTEKENQIKDMIKDKLRPKIFNEIYQKEFKNISEKIKKELEKDLEEEYKNKNESELEDFKKSQNYARKAKEEEIENDIREKVKKKVDETIEKELEIKEKELKLKSIQKYEAFRKKILNELQKDYDIKKNEIQKEIDEIKADIYRSKCSENIKTGKIMLAKKNINVLHDKILIGAQKVEKILNNETDYLENASTNKDKATISEINNNFLSDYNSNEINSCNIEDKEFLNQRMRSVEDNLVNLYNKEQQQEINQQKLNKKIINTNQKTNQPKIDGSVNLMEINKKIKDFTAPTGNINNTESDNTFLNEEEKETQKLRVLNQNQNAYDYSNFISNNPDITGQKNCQIKTDKQFQDQELKENISNINNSNPLNTCNLEEINALNTLKNKKERNYLTINSSLFHSIQIDGNIPTSVASFGKYLITHIENEENYRILYHNELKKLKGAIQKMFRNSKSSDHCLMEYMIELWNKLDISYIVRYKILNNLIKLNSLQVYSFLDKETEYLTNYFQISENIFKNIRTRENIKLKLQTKINRKENIPEDKNGLDNITQIIEEQIEKFKNKYKGLDIIWKGIRYEWFMNYESWFYEITKK